MKKKALSIILSLAMILPLTNTYASGAVLEDKAPVKESVEKSVEETEKELVEENDEETDYEEKSVEDDNAGENEADVDSDDEADCVISNAEAEDSQEEVENFLRGLNKDDDDELLGAKTFNVEAAVQFAEAHWDTDSSWLCAEYVSRILMAGGLEGMTNIKTAGSCFNTAASLSGLSKRQLVLNSSGYATKASNEAYFGRGDIVVQYCTYCQKYPHVMFCGGYDDKGASFYSHNASRHNKSMPLNSNSLHTTANCRVIAYGLHLSQLAVNYPAPTMEEFKITSSNIQNGTYTVSATVYAEGGMSRIAFPTWTESGGQDDLIWHEGAITSLGGNRYRGTFTVNKNDHRGERGVYVTDAYAYDMAGKCSESKRVSINLDIPAGPTIKGYGVSSVDYEKGKYTVWVLAEYPGGFDHVQFPTWTSYNGQDDLVPDWPNNTSIRTTYCMMANMTNYGSGLFSYFDVKISDHNNERGDYITHIYVYDKYGQTTCVGVSQNMNIPDIEPTIDSVNMTLSGAFEMNFYFDSPSDAVKSASATMNGRTITKDIGSLTKVDGLYKMPFDGIPAKDFEGNVTLTLYDEKGNALTLKNGNSNNGKSYTQSVSDYLLDLMLSPNINTANLGGEMYTLGLFAKDYFGNGAKKNLVYLGKVKASTLADYKAKETGKLNDGVVYLGSTLLLDSRTTIRHYFNKRPSTFFVVDGKLYTGKEKDGLYYIEITNINAMDYDKAYKVTCDKWQLEYSVFSYAEKALSKGDNKDLCALVEQLYNYHNAAKTAFGK